MVHLADKDLVPIWITDAKAIGVLRGPKHPADVDPKPAQTHRQTHTHMHNVVKQCWNNEMKIVPIEKKIVPKKNIVPKKIVPKKEAIEQKALSHLGTLPSLSKSRKYAPKVSSSFEADRRAP